MNQSGVVRRHRYGGDHLESVQKPGRQIDPTLFVLVRTNVQTRVTHESIAASYAMYSSKPATSFSARRIREVGVLCNSVGLHRSKDSSALPGLVV